MASSRRNFSISFKREVVKYINEDHTAYQAVKFFENKYKARYTESNFRRWYENRQLINQQPTTRKRLVGAGRKPILGELEDVLYDEVIELRLANVKVTRRFLRDRALHLASERQDVTFDASNRWATSFMNRFQLSLRRTTNFTVLNETQIVSRAVSYMNFLRDIKSSADPAKTLLMDETAVYMEDARTQTIDIKGRKHVVMKTTGFASMRITVAAAVRVNGQKAVPLVIHKGVTGNIRACSGIVATNQSRGWVDSTLLIKWIDHMFPAVDTSDGRTLVWDSCRAHISAAVKEHCVKRGIKMVVIPGGMTPYLQAGDIGIYKAFKDSISVLIDTWKNSNEVEYTKGGNPKPPKQDRINEWVRDAWRSIPQETIKKSVNAAGFAFNYKD